MLYGTQKRQQSRIETVLVKAMTKLTKAARYTAGWIVDDTMPDDGGDFDPAYLKWGYSSWDTWQQANDVAKLNADQGPMGGYWTVYQEVWNPDHYEPGIGAWEIVRSWVEGSEVPL